MAEVIIKHCFVELNKSFVHIEQYGQSHRNLLKQLTQTAGHNDSGNSSTCNTSSNNNNEVKNHLVIFIPGNPGALGVYHDFLRLVAKQVARGDGATAILAIGHNNFDHPDHVNYPAEEKIFLDEKKLNFVEKTLAGRYIHDPHHVELQVLNKLIILKRLIRSLDSPAKVTFVGHSIGCYVILRLLQDKQLASMHANSILIHPALENLALTEKGRFFDRVFQTRLDLPTKLIAFLLDTLLPRSLKMTLTRYQCSREFVENSSDEVLESMMQLVCSRHLSALVGMAKSELAYVKQLDCEQLIKHHVPKLKLLYAMEDHWVNESHRRALKRLYRDEIHIEERDTLHAFVMDPKAVAEYANIVTKFVDKVSAQ